MRKLRSKLRFRQTRKTNRQRKASSDLQQILAYNVIMYRFRNGLTQRDLAILCGWDKEYVVRIEYGLVNMPLAHIDKLVDTLECTLEDLLTSKNIDELNRINRFKQRKRAAKGLA